jgi:molybdopterin synthase catalytic subunit
MKSPSCRLWPVADVAYLTREPIRLEPLVNEVASPARGGIATFLGLVRDHHEDRAVTGLNYSAYEPMAESTCQEIRDEAEARWPVRVALRHRLGQLDIGDVAVAIAVGCGHRDEAFAACRYVIEELKRRVPIWKLETYADGTEAWVDPTQQASGIRGQGAGSPS